MPSEKKQHIVCAVRGGPESRETVSCAIELALVSGARLTYLQVMDVEFLNHATVAPLSIIYRELQNMAQFTMQILCDRAERRGIEGASCSVRTGNIPRQIRQFVTEQDVDLLVMGRPVRSPGTNVFKPNQFDSFVADLRETTHVQVVVATPATGAEG